MRVVTIEEVATVVRGSSPRPSGDPRYYGGNIPRLMVSDVTRDGMYVTPKIDFLTTEGAAKSRPMLKGDLIIAVSGDPGEPCILNVDACIHDGFVGFREMDVTQVDTPYLYHFFKLIKQTNKDQAVGAIYKNLNTDQIKKIKIPLPPLPTQQKIAAILDAADELRQKDKALVAKYDELTQALFLDMFGDPITNPKGWEKVELKKLCSFKKKNIKPEEIINGTKYVALDSVEKETGKIITIYKVEQGEIKSNKFWFDDTYILYGKLRPYLNKVALPSFKGVCSTDIIPIQPISKISNREFISAILKHPSFVSFAHERSSGANLPRISPTEVEKYLTISPPFTLQCQFAERVKAIEEQKNIAQASALKSEELFNSLLQKAFNGELV